MHAIGGDRSFAILVNHGRANFLLANGLTGSGDLTDLFEFYFARIFFFGQGVYKGHTNAGRKREYVGDEMVTIQ